MVVSLVLSVAIGPAAQAQSVVLFGDRTPCRDWLNTPSGNPQQGQQIASWVLGFWSGLNMAAAGKISGPQPGYTMQNADVRKEVWAACTVAQQLPIGGATLLAYSRVAEQHR